MLQSVLLDVCVSYLATYPLPGCVTQRRQSWDNNTIDYYHSSRGGIVGSVLAVRVFMWSHGTFKRSSLELLST